MLTVSDFPAHDFDRPDVRMIVILNDRSADDCVLWRAINALILWPAVSKDWTLRRRFREAARSVDPRAHGLDIVNKYSGGAAETYEHASGSAVVLEIAPAGATADTTFALRLGGL